MPVQVPKFIEREPRIVGPLTLKQFIYIGTAGAATFGTFFLVKNMFIFLPLAVLFITSGVSLAFVKVNGKTMPDLILAMLSFSVKPQKYIWEQQDLSLPQTPEEKRPQQEPQKTVSSSKVQLHRESKVGSLAKKIETV